MSISLDLRPELEARLVETAAEAGLSPEQYLIEWIEQIPERRPVTSEVLPVDDLAKLIAKYRGTATVIPPSGDLGELLAQWRVEDATDDEEELDRRDAEWKELRANLNANRAATGERLLFLDDDQ